MKRVFFLILFTWILLVPSIAGCADGEPHVRRRSMDAGPIVGPSMDAGRVPLDSGMDAWVSPPGAPPLASGGVDAGSPVTVSSHDAGSAPDAYVTIPDPGEPHLLLIGLSSAVRAQCPAGWRIRLWLTDPPVESTRGLDLELHIPVLTRWGPWTSITLWCDERVPQWYVWDQTDRDAFGSGVFSELSLDGADLRATTELCEDPLAPGTGYRPIIMWEDARRGSCPP